MIFIELYSGHGTMSNAFKHEGFQTVSVDIRKRKGVCEPSHNDRIIIALQDNVHYRCIQFFKNHHYVFSKLSIQEIITYEKKS
jgi:hypothetical protein